jgi:hypothetical protein
MQRDRGFKRNENAHQLMKKVCKYLYTGHELTCNIMDIVAKWAIVKLMNKRLQEYQSLHLVNKCQGFASRILCQENYGNTEMK